MTTREPTPKDLRMIRKWDANDFSGLLEFIREIWKYSDCGYFKEQESGVYLISTAGWSDNEEIIAAMKRNIIWWLLYWELSRRGGHYQFGRRSYE